MRPTGPIRAHICAAYASYAPSTFCPRVLTSLHRIHMLKRASDWTYTRSHLRCLRLCLRKLRSLDILSKSFDLFAQDSHVKACFRLDLYALTSACNIRDYLRSHLRSRDLPTQGSSFSLFKSSHMTSTLPASFKCYLQQQLAFHSPT